MTVVRWKTSNWISVREAEVRYWLNPTQYLTPTLTKSKAVVLQATKIACRKFARVCRGEMALCKSKSSVAEATSRALTENRRTLRAITRERPWFGSVLQTAIDAICWESGFVQKFLCPLELTVG